MKKRPRPEARRSERTRSRPRRPGRGRWARRLAVSAFRIKVGLVILTALCLTLALNCLERIGPPPALRWDALWVHQHRDVVRFGVISLLAAGIATGMLLLTRRAKWWALLLWLVAIAVAAIRFWDRLPIILRVLIDHA